MSANTVIVGNLTADPELKFTSLSVALVRFRLAVNERIKNKDTHEWEDGKTTFISCQAWRQLAEDIAENFTRGMRVMVTGKLEMNEVEKDGVKTTYYQVNVDEAGVSIKNVIIRLDRKSKEASSRAKHTAPEADPWAIPANF